MIKETEKNSLSPEIELTNMVMIEDKKTCKVLVQERIKSWTGLSFPGGHVEAGESFVESAIREVKEETGLDIRNLKSCGIIHWAHKDTLDRYIVHLYKTNDFSGELIGETEEGRVFWLTVDELKKSRLSNNFGKYLKMFLEDKYNEFYCFYRDGEPEAVSYTHLTLPTMAVV